MAKRAASLFSIDVISPDADRRPAHMRVLERIQAAISSGALPLNARLPSSRTLAGDLGLSRNTVDEALSRLVAEGFVVRRRGIGSFVSSSAPAHRKTPRPRTLDTQRGRPRARLSNRAKTLTNYPGHYKPIEPVPFTPSMPPAEFFPRKTWQRLLSREVRRPEADYWHYGASNGLPLLREAIAAHANAMRATRASADQVVVTTSTQQAVELAAKVLADPGESAWIEVPGYQPVLHCLRGAGLNVVPVPVDEQGLSVEAGLNLQPHARLAYVTPAHQYPMGYEMSLLRRNALLEWSRGEGAYIVEDDYDGDYRYEGRPIASLQGMEPERVIYIGSFNKILFPGLRIAYAIVPELLVGPFVDAKHAADGHTQLLSQGVLAAFISEGHLGEHLRATRMAYNERRSSFLKEAQALDGMMKFGPALAGMHVTATFGSPNIDDRAVAEDCARRGVVVGALSRFGDANRHGLVFGFAVASSEASRAGLVRVKEAILAQIKRQGSDAALSRSPKDRS
jgi:GntR family transcriptional regulator / MocR family aminotransferase